MTDFRLSFLHHPLPRRKVLQLSGAAALTLTATACGASSSNTANSNTTGNAGSSVLTGTPAPAEKTAPPPSQEHASQPYFQGVEYKRVPHPHPTGKKTVLEVFYYGCPHCYHLAPSLEKWLATKPADVTFDRMPAVLGNPSWIFFARAYYTAANLGILDKSHRALFDALHRDQQDLFSVEKLAEFHSRFGVKPEDYIKMFKSFKVDMQVKEAGKLTQDYGIDGVPTLIVNGTWSTDVSMAGGSYAALWKLVDWLVEQPVQAAV